MTTACEFLRSLMIFWILIALSTPALAQKQTSEEDLVRQTQNPVADLISVPLQNNFNFGTGSKNRTVYVGNIQPVIPISLNPEWNLITRTIMPIINQPSLFPVMGSATGLGDINPTFFFSPAKPGELIWGVGPIFTLPTATRYERIKRWLAEDVIQERIKLLDEIIGILTTSIGTMRRKRVSSVE